MGITRLQAVLRRHRRIAVDSSVFIYQLEANRRYGAIANEIFEWIESPAHSAVTSTITLMEVLVVPYRLADQELVDRYYSLLTRYPHLEWTMPSLEIADIAARLRAGYRLKPPDALQAATAVRTSATALVTNDAVFDRVESFESIILERFLA